MWLVRSAFCWVKKISYSFFRQPRWKSCTLHSLLRALHEFLEESTHQGALLKATRTPPPPPPWAQRGGRSCRDELQRAKLARTAAAITQARIDGYWQHHHSITAVFSLAPHSSYSLLIPITSLFILLFLHFLSNITPPRQIWKTIAQSLWNCSSSWIYVTSFPPFFSCQFKICTAAYFLTMFLWNLPQRLRPHFSELWCPRSTLKSHLTSYYKILKTGWEISLLIRWHYNDRQEEKITWIFNIFAKHFCNEEMEKLALQFSEVSEEEKIWGWFGSIASFTSFWQTPGPVRSHVPCPGCHFSPEVSAFEPRTTIYIYIKKM